MSVGAPAFVIVAFAFPESKLRWNCVEADTTSACLACVLVPTSRVSESAGLTTPSCPKVGDLLSMSAL